MPPTKDTGRDYAVSQTEAIRLGEQSRPRRSSPRPISDETPDEETWDEVVHTLKTLVFGVDLEPIQPTLVKAKPDTKAATKTEPAHDAKATPQPIEEDQS